MQPISATLGIALPTPGLPMPQPAADASLDVSDPGVQLPSAGLVAGGGAGPSGAGPAPIYMPAAIPIAPVVAMPGVPTPYTAMLTKAAFGVGFGLLLDGDNVVTGIKPESATANGIIDVVGRILPGDRVLAINGKPVSPEVPAKSLVADIDEGVTVPFTMLRIPPTDGPISAATPPPMAVPGPPVYGIQGGGMQPMAASPPIVQPTIINPADPVRNLEADVPISPLPGPPMTVPGPPMTVPGPPVMLPGPPIEYVNMYPPAMPVALPHV